jgi:Fe2+ or Zn2+ uptake regulation protein
MSCIEQLSETLRASGYRITPQRLAVLQALHVGGHMSPSQIYERTRQSIPGMTEATVYRTLEFLAENDVALYAKGENSHLAYELALTDHHHMVCRACDHTETLEHGLVQEFYNQIEAITGFRPTTGHLTLTGLCAGCKRSTGGE